MGYTFRTPGPWGPGKGSDLTGTEVDANFWQAQQDIAAKATQGVGIANITVIGNLMYVVLTDHTLLGPYTLPVATLNFRGPWQPNKSYLANDVVTYNGAAYAVLVNHVSDITFDPMMTDGQGHNLYQEILAQPSIQLPAGGPAGYFLMKSTSADYVTTWGRPSLSNLTDVGLGSPLIAGDLLGWTGSFWTNVEPPSSGGSTTLAGLTDVALAAPIVGQPLVYSGTKWANPATVDLPCSALQTATGAVAINRANGEWQRFSVTGNVTTSAILGWPTGQQGARLVLEIVNTGGFTWSWAGAGVIWSGGHAPLLTPNGKDVYVLVSFNGGTTVYGSAAGQNFM